MRARECEKCGWSVRKTWSHPYTPATGRTIGMTHAFRWCNYHGQRCADVKRCERKKSSFYPNADEDGMVDVSGYPFTK